MNVTGHVWIHKIHQCIYYHERNLRPNNVCERIDTSSPFFGVRYFYQKTWDPKSNQYGLDYSSISSFQLIFIFVCVFFFFVAF